MGRCRYALWDDGDVLRDGDEASRSDDEFVTGIPPSFRVLRP
jgi:hypothetical protein